MKEYKTDEWLSFDCNQCQIKKLFKTEKERKRFIRLHTKFCSINILPFQYDEKRDLGTGKIIS